MKRHTTWQRAVLVAMFLMAERAKEPLQVEFTRRTLERILWFDWHGYHTAAINKLVSTGWLQGGKTEDGLVAYKLTRATMLSVATDRDNAMANIRYVPLGQLDLM